MRNPEVWGWKHGSEPLTRFQGAWGTGLWDSIIGSCLSHSLHCRPYGKWSYLLGLQHSVFHTDEFAHTIMWKGARGFVGIVSLIWHKAAGVSTAVAIFKFAGHMYRQVYVHVDVCSVYMGLFFANAILRYSEST